MEVNHRMPHILSFCFILQRPCYPHRRSTTVSLETFTLYLCVITWKSRDTSINSCFLGKWNHATIADIYKHQNPYTTTRERNTIKQRRQTIRPIKKWHVSTTTEAVLYRTHTWDAYQVTAILHTLHPSAFIWNYSQQVGVFISSTLLIIKSTE